VAITVAEPDGNFPDFEDQLHEVLSEGVNHAPVACRQRLESDSTAAMAVGGVNGDSVVMTIDTG
jgi:hypothetical protein